jgi:hypothetical protein
MIPAYEVKRAFRNIRDNDGARPGGKMKKIIQTTLHRNYTFQNPDDLSKAASIIGIEKFWDQIEREFPRKLSKATIRKKLWAVAIRRNQIVHEADIPTTVRDHGIPAVRKISEKQAHNTVVLIENLVSAIEKVTSK